MTELINERAQGEYDVDMDRDEQVMSAADALEIADDYDE